jgi:RNA polymerase I-specific transcription initiation factor RRN5
MSSGDESAQDLSSDSGTPLQSRASSRLQSQTPGTPRKRRRIESVDTSRVRKYYLEGKYNDAYRVLFNEDVSRVAARFELEDGIQHYTTQYGVSTWTSKEQATLFAALGRLGRDDVAGIAQAVGTKSITETHELLLLLKDATAKKGDLGLTLRDVPAATEVGEECDEELDIMAEALAWYQEQWDVTEERERYGDYWLITPAIAEHIETALNGPFRAVSTQPATPASPGTPRVGPGIAGYVHPHHIDAGSTDSTIAPASAVSTTRYAATERSLALTVRG